MADPAVAADRAVGGVCVGGAGGVLLQAVPGAHEEPGRLHALSGLRHVQLFQRADGGGGAPSDEEAGPAPLVTGGS